MSKRKNFTAFTKGPSKADIEALQKKREQEEKELVEKMNIPPRDENKYPMPDKKDIAEAGWQSTLRLGEGGTGAGGNF